jgi:hypothetical protein
VAFLAAVNDAAAASPLSSARKIGSSTRDGTLMFRRLGERELVFDEAHQAIYEVDAIAAHVGRSLNMGMGPEQIARELVEHGFAPDGAEQAVHSAIAALQTAAVPQSGNADQISCLTVSIAGVAVDLQISAALVHDVRELFGSLIVDAGNATCRLSARLSGGNVRFSSPGRPDWCCDRSEFLPLLKAQLIEFAIQFARFEVALHAAALAKGDKAVLLVGSPGAGKTTLAIALAKSGLELVADDVTLLHADGTVTGITLPFSVKASAWPLLEKFWPGMTDRPVHCRPDGQSLCYVPHDRLAAPRPRRIGVIVLLDRHTDAETRVDAVDPVDALTALMAEGVTRDQQLHPGGFAALVDGLPTARCHRLVYSDLREGARAVIGLLE